MALGAWAGREWNGTMNRTRLDAAARLVERLPFVSRNPAAFWQLARFGIVGVGATIVHVLTVVALVDGAGLRFVWANPAGFIAGFVVSYAGHLTWTFGQRGNHRRRLPRFIVVWLCGFTAGQVLGWLIVEVLGLPYGIALALTVTAIPVASFLAGRFWVFRPA